jgi:hypothetical protein
MHSSGLRRQRDLASIALGEFCQARPDETQAALPADTAWEPGSISHPTDRKRQARKVSAGTWSAGPRRSLGQSPPA